MFSQIKDIKHIEHNFHSVDRVMPRVGTWGCGGESKSFSVRICDGAPSTERFVSVLFLLCFHAHLFIDALCSPAGKVLAPWLSFVMSNYFKVITFTLVSWVRCGA